MLNLRWIKVHRYWFGFTMDERAGHPVVTQLLFDQADMPRRLLRAGTPVPWPGAS